MASSDLFIYFYFLQEAFSIVREASKRVLGLRPFDVQLIGWFSTWIFTRLQSLIRRK